MNFDKQALDRYITGNYGEDQFKEEDDDECEHEWDDYWCDTCGDRHTNCVYCGEELI